MELMVKTFQQLIFFAILVENWNQLWKINLLKFSWKKSSPFFTCSVGLLPKRWTCQVAIHRPLQYWQQWRLDLSYGTSPGCPQVVAALIWCHVAMHMSRIDSSPTVHAFTQAVQLTICLCRRKHSVVWALLISCTAAPRLSKGKEPNWNSPDCGLCQQDANGPPPGSHVLFLQGTDVQSALPGRNIACQWPWAQTCWPTDPRGSECCKQPCGIEPCGLPKDFHLPVNPEWLELSADGDPQRHQHKNS